MMLVASHAPPAMAAPMTEDDAGKDTTKNFLPNFPGLPDLCKNNPQLCTPLPPGGTDNPAPNPTPPPPAPNPTPPPPVDNPTCGFGEIFSPYYGNKCIVEYYVCLGAGGVVDKTTDPPKCVPTPPGPEETEGCLPDQQHPGKPYGCCPEGQKKNDAGNCVKIPDPPPECPDGKAKDNDGKCPNTGGGNGGGSGGGYGGGSGGGYGGGSGGTSDGVGGVIDGGGVFVSNILPSDFTSAVGDGGNSVKQNLPALVAKTLPNTGGGWVTLALAGGALLLAGGFLKRGFSR
jgi:hypothetical protein